MIKARQEKKTVGARWCGDTLSLQRQDSEMRGRWAIKGERHEHRDRHRWVDYTS